jgi:glycosyltransferase involved in cell wall biosynthesis
MTVSRGGAEDAEKSDGRGRRPLITLLSSNVSENAFVRTWLLAEILSRDFDVQVLGTDYGGGLWHPARGQPLAVDTVPGRRWPFYASSVSALLRRIRGDVVYAIKPLFASYGVALLHRRRAGTPVILDVDDEELSFRPGGSLRHPRQYAVSLLHPDGRTWARVALARRHAADATTVAGWTLRERYGGVVVPHAKDTARIRPRPDLRDAAKARLGVAGRRVVLFMGTPRAYSGVEDAADAVGRMRNEAAFVVVGGNPENPFLRGLRASLPNVLFREAGLDDVAFLIQAADAVVVPQRLHEQTVRQVPSKLLDAMAAAKPAVSTAVSDIPRMLADGRGLVVPPSDPPALAAALDRVLDHPDEAAEMGRRARAWVEENAGYDAAQVTLREVMRGVLTRR